MKNKDLGKLLEVSFALASVAIAWQVGIQTGLRDLATYLGAVEGSLLWTAIVEYGPPIAVLGVAALAMWVYRRGIWPFLYGSTYQQGWWVYALIAHTPNGIVDIAGYFRVLHSPDRLTIREGRAHYMEKNRLRTRGEWYSDEVWYGDDRLRFFFTMKSAQQLLEESPDLYVGQIALERVQREPVVGKTTWSGHFGDLGDRRVIQGPVYAERLSRFRKWNTTKVERLVGERAQRLLEIAHP